MSMTSSDRSWLILNSLCTSSTRALQIVLTHNALWSEAMSRNPSIYLATWTGRHRIKSLYRVTPEEAFADVGTTIQAGSTDSMSIDAKLSSPLSSFSISSSRNNGSPVRGCSFGMPYSGVARISRSRSGRSSDWYVYSVLAMDSASKNSFSGNNNTFF